MPKSLLLTGGAGFIGSHLCSALLPGSLVTSLRQTAHDRPLITLLLAGQIGYLVGRVGASICACVEGSEITERGAGASTAALVLRQVPILGRYDGRFLLLQRLHDGGVEIQMTLHQFRRRQCHPLVQRHISKHRAAEHLKEA